eukprot:6046822-Pleurochrysis_carterae.AAC.1
MAAERQPARIRRERAEIKGRESHETKLNTEIDWTCCEDPESLRCAATHPRDGQQWALGVPTQGFTLAEPKQSSLGACEQRTRGRAGAPAGPEPALENGRNRHKAGEQWRHKQHAVKLWYCILMVLMGLAWGTHLRDQPVTREVTHEQKGLRRARIETTEPAYGEASKHKWQEEGVDNQMEAGIQHEGHSRWAEGPHARRLSGTKHEMKRHGKSQQGQKVTVPCKRRPKRNISIMPQLQAQMLWHSTNDMELTSPHANHIALHLKQHAMRQRMLHYGARGTADSRATQLWHAHYEPVQPAAHAPKRDGHLKIGDTQAPPAFRGKRSTDNSSQQNPTPSIINGTRPHSLNRTSTQQMHVHPEGATRAACKRQWFGAYTRLEHSPEYGRRPITTEKLILHSARPAASPPCLPDSLFEWLADRPVITATLPTRPTCRPVFLQHTSSIITTSLP